MSTDDDSDEQYQTTRRNAMKAGGSFVLVPASHQDQSTWDRIKEWLGQDSDKAGTGENVYLKVNDELITEDTKTLHLQGYGVGEAVEKNEHADEGVAIVQLDVEDEDINPRSVGTEDIGSGIIRQADIEEPTRHQHNEREIWSTKPRTIYVDPSGSLPADGSADDPFPQPDHAIDRVPQFIQHETVIDIADGTYDGGKVDPAVMHFIGGEPHDQPFRIVGNPSTPENVVMKQAWDFAFREGNELDDPTVEGLTFEGGVENQGGMLKITDCVFRDQGGLIASFVGHNAGTTIFQRCRFEKPITRAIQAHYGHKVILLNCEINGTDYGIHASQGARVVIDESTAPVGGDLGGWKAERGATIIGADGQPYNNKKPLMDDWDDGELSNRFRTAAGYRPDWRIRNGSPTTGDGYVELASGGQIDTATSMTTGTWETVFEAQTAPSSGTLKVRPMSPADDRVEVRLADTAVALYLNGTQEAVDSSGWAGDTAQHSLEITRSTDIDGSGNPGYAVDIDGSNVLQVKSTYIPDMIGSTRFDYRNDWDVAVRFYELQERLE